VIDGIAYICIHVLITGVRTVSSIQDAHVARRDWCDNECMERKGGPLLLTSFIIDRRHWIVVVLAVTPERIVALSGPSFEPMSSPSYVRGRG
jgi:hypothetical protein